MNKKKILTVLLAGAMLLGLCSCDGYFTIKPDGPTETEEETTTEEATTTTTIEETTEDTTEATTEATTKATTEATAAPSSEVSATGKIFVSFQDKTAAEIKENLIRITQITKDTNLDNYPDSFDLYPNGVIYKDDDISYCTYCWDPVGRNSSEGLDHVMVHIVRKSDGSLDPGSRVTIEIITEDKARWEELYTVAREAVMAVCGVDSLMTSGAGDNESSLYMTYFVTKKIKDEGYYTLLIDMPLKEVAENTDDMP